MAGCLLWPHPYPLVALGTHTLGAGGMVSPAGRGFPTLWSGPWESSMLVLTQSYPQLLPWLSTASQTSCFLISANGGDHTHLPHRC